MKFKMFCFYKKESIPEIDEFEQNDCDLNYYANNLLTMSFVIGNESGELPILSVLYVDGKFYAYAVPTGKEGVLK